MATKKVTYWECDNCAANGSPDLEINTTDPLPKNWVGLTMRSDHGYHFELTLCTQCSAEVLKALKKRHKEDGD